VQGSRRDRPCRRHQRPTLIPRPRESAVRHRHGQGSQKYAGGPSHPCAFHIRPQKKSNTRDMASLRANSCRPRYGCFPKTHRYIQSSNRSIQDAFSLRKEPDPGVEAFGCDRRICPGRFLADSGLYMNIVQLLAVLNVSKAVDEKEKEIEVNVRRYFDLSQGS
jgi:hypothetical protein